MTVWRRQARRVRKTLRTSPGPEFNTTVPHSARIWNYWLGGKDNCAVDREAGDQYVKIYPGIVSHRPRGPDIPRPGRAVPDP